MRTKILIFTLLLAVFALPVFAQDSAPAIPISFSGFGFEYPSYIGPNVNISWYPGDPITEVEQKFGDGSHTQFTFYETFPVPESVWDAKAGIRLYGIDTIAQYSDLKQQVEQLKSLLSEQPDLTTFESADADNLPFVPPAMHGQIIRARAHYVETDAFKGVSYVIATPIMDAFEPFLHDTFYYVFQGISADGNLYVSAAFHLDTSLFPAALPTDFDMATFQAQMPDYLKATIATLNAGQPEDFSPSLTDLDTLIQSFNLEA
ncbi:MAG: hypothetical protein ABI690_07960 [Chloroflexota bacterium]